MPQTIISQFSRAYNEPIETYRRVSTITSRDSIPSNIRWEGMLVYVTSEETTYQLKGGIDNTKWEELGANTGGGSLPYTSYQAILTTDPGGPIVNELYTNGGGMVWARISTGVYTATPNDAYDKDSTLVFANVTSSGTLESDEFVTISKNISYISFHFYKGGSLSDNSNNIDIEIRQF